MKVKCLKCESTKDLTKHHILPSRHFKIKKCIVILCRRCHNRADRLTIDKEFYVYGRLTKMEEAEYVKLFEQFLAEKMEGL